VKIFLDRRERLAGLFLVATGCLVLAWFAGAAIRNRWFDDKVVFHTRLARGDGLRQGSPVLVSGVEIGEVGRIQILDDDQIDVELVVVAAQAGRVREGTQAVVKRLLGIGEKRIQLVAAAAGRPLRAGAILPAREPVDLMELVADLDLTAAMKTSARAIAVFEKLLATLEQKDRFERMVASLDRIGPTLERVDRLLDALHAPAVALVGDPSLRGAIHGLDDVLHDPATRRALRNAGQALDPKRIDQVLARVDALADRIDAIAGRGSQLHKVLEHADGVLTDPRIGRLTGAFERLADEKKLASLLDNLTVVAEQTGKVGPEIPRLTKELTLTLREAVVVLKALQKTWMLESKADDARKELQRDGKEAPKGQGN